MGVDGGHIACKLWIDACSAIDRQLGVENQSFVAVSSLFGLAERAADELGLRCFKVTTELLNQTDKIRFVVGGVAVVIAVFVPCQKKNPAISYDSAPG